MWHPLTVSPLSFSMSFPSGPPAEVTSCHNLAFRLSCSISLSPTQRKRKKYLNPTSLLRCNLSQCHADLHEECPVRAKSLLYSHTCTLCQLHASSVQLLMRHRELDTSWSAWHHWLDVHQWQRTLLRCTLSLHKVPMMQLAAPMPTHTLKST